MPDKIQTSSKKVVIDIYQLYRQEKAEKEEAQNRVPLGSSSAFKELHKVELQGFREEKARIVKGLRDRGWVMHSEMTQFLTHQASELISKINSKRGDLPPRVRIEGVGMIRNLPIEITEYNGEFYAVVRVRLNRESGNGWGSSVDPGRSWRYFAPNGMGTWGPPRNGADLISLYNNGWDTGGKVIYYKKKYSYTEGSKTGQKRNVAKSNYGKKKEYRHTYRNGNRSNSKIKYVTRSKKDPLYYITDPVYDMGNIDVFLNDYLYTLDGCLGMYHSGVMDKMSPWDYTKDYFCEEPLM
jgi:hypothetical protein